MTTFQPGYLATPVDIIWRSENWLLNPKETSILGYLDVVAVERLVVVGVDTLDDVDSDDDVDNELEVETLQGKDIVC